MKPNHLLYARPILLALLFALCSRPAFPWGCTGHQVVALIAEHQLTPEIRASLEKLLAENPVDPQLKRYCTPSTGDSLLDASTWPDDVRNTAKNGPWHYINIPRGVPHGPLDAYCGDQGCITFAIAEQWAILKNPKASSARRAEAARYLIHFVADLHMPLHASDNNDLGGNCVPVRFFDRAPQQHTHTYSPNLHSVWDVEILERLRNSAEPSEFAANLEKKLANDSSVWRNAGIHVDDWAWESHDLADSVVYAELTPPVPIEPPQTVHVCTDANDIGARMLALKVSAGQAYQDIAAPIVEKRLAQAGIRLAMILNDALAPSATAH